MTWGEQLSLLERDARRARDAAESGMSRAYDADRVQLWKSAADAWLAQLAFGAAFTADDLVTAIGLPDAGPARNNVVGAWIGAQSKRRLIRFTGEFKKSERVIGHGNLQRVWLYVA